MIPTEFQSPSVESPVIQSGVCYVVFAYDAARMINLEVADRRIHEATERPSIAHKRRTPSYFEFQPTRSCSRSASSRRAQAWM